MQHHVHQPGTPYSALLRGELASYLAGLFTTLLLHPGRRTWLNAGSTVSSFFTPAYLMDRAASQDRQVLYVACSSERRDEMRLLLSEIYRRPVAGTFEQRTRGSVTVLTLPELFMLLQEDPHGMAGMDAVLVEHHDETTEYAWLMQYLMDRSAANASVVGIELYPNQEQPDLYPHREDFPQWSMKDNPGLTPLGNSAAAAKTLMRNRFKPDPALHFTRNSYEYAQEGTLVERYMVFSQLMGFALLTGLSDQWTVERHTEIFGLDVATFMTLGTWCYASIPTDEFAGHFVDELRAYQQPAALA